MPSGTPFGAPSGGVAAPIANASLAAMAARTRKANATSGSAVPTDVADVFDFARTVLGSQGTSITVSGLNGDTDVDYEVEFYLICATNAPGAVRARPNNLSTNQNSSSIYNFAGVGVTTDTALLLWNTGGTATIAGRFRLRSGTSMGARFFSSEAADLVNNQVVSAGVWNQTSTNITSLVIIAANANAFDTGSWMSVRAVRKSYA